MDDVTPRVPFLRFEGLAEMVGWDGPWPPPEKMAVAVGHVTGMTAHIDLDKPGAEDRLAVAREIADLTYYRRESYSTLPLDIPAVWRGAQYRLDGLAEDSTNGATDG